MKKQAVLFLAAAALLVACENKPAPRPDGGNSDSGAPTCNASTGMSYKYIVDVLQVPTSPVVGFNLDGNNVGECLREDGSQNPAHELAGAEPGDRSGVDASLNSAFGTFSSRIDVSARDGTVMILAELRGVDSLVNDPCVDVALYLGETDNVSNINAPVRGPMVSEGHIVPNQEFRVDPLSYADPVARTPRIVLRGARITNGQLSTVGAGGDVELSLAVNGSLVRFTIKNAQIRGTVSASTITNGVLGGAIKIDDLERTLCGCRNPSANDIRACRSVGNPDVRGSGCCSETQRTTDGCRMVPGVSGSGMMWTCNPGSVCTDDAILPAIPPTTAITLVAPNVDLDPDENGECQRASVALTFSTVTARF